MPGYNHCPDIEEKLRARQYHVSSNYGLIMEKENDERVIADIRGCERKVVLPLIEISEETEKQRTLKRILKEEGIDFRDKSRVKD